MRDLLPWYLILWRCVWCVPCLLSLGLFAGLYGLFRLSWTDVVKVWKEYM